MRRNKLSKRTKRAVGDCSLLILTSFLLTFVCMFVYEFNLYFITHSYVTYILTSVSVFVFLSVLYFYIVKNSADRKIAVRNSFMTFITLFASVCVSAVMSHAVDPYANTLILTIMLVTVLVDKKLGIYTHIFQGIVFIILTVAAAVVYGESVTNGQIIAVITSLLAGFFLSGLPDKNYTRFKMIWGSLLVVIVYAVLSGVIATFYTLKIEEIVSASLWALVGGGLSVAMYTALLPIFEAVFKVWTNFKLAEVASFSNPLLKRLQQEAPGTFNHSLIVGNLSENCAMAIGENPYLARVAAYYHDVGKLKNPSFFIENQDKYNPHDELIPEVSVRMITRHTKAGYDILKENNMPEEIAQVALEHHGDSPVMYFYMKAQNITEGKLAMDNYRYDGPKPSTKIAAIVMICDTVEAATRAKRPETVEELDRFINQLIKEKTDLGQFDNCNITFEDLRKIKDTIVKTVPSIFHHRIDYNKEKK